MFPPGSPTAVAASDRTSQLVEELQYTLGGGPCLEAYESRRPVLTPDLTSGDVARWPGYAAAALDHGIGAVFAFPLQIGGARIGAFDVYRERPGPLTDEALSLAVTFADVALVTVLDAQARSGPGEPPEGIDDAMENRAQVHQAQGMVMVQLEVPLEEALIRLRAHAWATGRRLSDVARDVVARKMVMER